MSKRLKNVNTGVIVGVSDEKASRMGSEWELIEGSAQPASAPIPDAPTGVEPAPVIEAPVGDEPAAQKRGLFKKNK